MRTMLFPATPMFVLLDFKIHSHLWATGADNGQFDWAVDPTHLLFSPETNQTNI